MVAEYIDIDLSLDRHPGTGDVFSIRDDAAVKQSIMNILRSKAFDKPFDPDYGLNLNGMLFEHIHPGYKVMVKKKIEEMLFRYEKRAIIEDVVITVSEDDNETSIVVYYRVIGRETITNINITVERTR